MAVLSTHDAGTPNTHHLEIVAVREGPVAICTIVMVVDLVLFDILYGRVCFIALGAFILEVVEIVHVLPSRILRAELTVAIVALKSRA